MQNKRKSVSRCESTKQLRKKKKKHNNEQKRVKCQGAELRVAAPGFKIETQLICVTPGFCCGKRGTFKPAIVSCVACVPFFSFLQYRGPYRTPAYPKRSLREVFARDKIQLRSPLTLPLSFEAVRQSMRCGSRCRVALEHRAGHGERPG